MKIIQTARQLDDFIMICRQSELKIGFVPTMGALHKGHITLVEQSIKENDITICSIFVNPTQFNDPEDFKKYPNTFEEDAKMLREINCSAIFFPAVKEMYPQKDERIFDFDGLDNTMEGKFRPGHFNGVAQIVSKLFEMVRPNNTYFGEKDFQQLAIVKKINEKYLSLLNINVVACPTLRESNGLAISSRNKLLSDKSKDEAGIIYNCLNIAKYLYKYLTVNDLKKYIIDIISLNPNIKLEYFEIVDSNNLQIIENYQNIKNARACIALVIEKVRLIDNIEIF